MFDDRSGSIVIFPNGSEQTLNMVNKLPFSNMNFFSKHSSNGSKSVMEKS